jgi:antitoxin (DNA-binding transcriptional repressor) of toxin-antitoxin stability system
MAGETANGSKNFRAPASVPNYFSNEAGPLEGPAAETRRGPLYPSQTAEAPAEATRAFAAAPPVRQHIAMAEPRGRLIRGRRGERFVAHHVTVHGRPVYRVAAHGSSHGRIEYIASRRRIEHVASSRARIEHVASRSTHTAIRTHSIGKTMRVGSTHRRARG